IVIQDVVTSEQPSPQLAFFIQKIDETVVLDPKTQTYLQSKQHVLLHLQQLLRQPVSATSILIKGHAHSSHVIAEEFQRWYYQLNGKQFTLQEGFVVASPELPLRWQETIAGEPESLPDLVKTAAK